MLPIQVMNATSESFFHKKLLKLGIGLIPGVGTAVNVVSDLVGGGGGGGSTETLAAALPRASGGIPSSAVRNASKHIAHGHLSKLLRGAPGHTGIGQRIIDAALGGTPDCGTGHHRDSRGGCVPDAFETTSPREMGEAGFQAVAGAFGMPAFAPARRDVLTWRCPEGMVLGRDNLCYPKQVLRRDSKFRKWRPGMRPVLTGGERRGISKAKRSITRAREATAGLGVTVQKRK